MRANTPGRISGFLVLVLLNTGPAISQDIVSKQSCVNNEKRIQTLRFFFGDEPTDNKKFQARFRAQGNKNGSLHFRRKDEYWEGTLPSGRLVYLHETTLRPRLGDLLIEDDYSCRYDYPNDLQNCVGVVELDVRPILIQVEAQPSDVRLRATPTLTAANYTQVISNGGCKLTFEIPNEFSLRLEGLDEGGSYVCLGSLNLKLEDLESQEWHTSLEVRSHLNPKCGESLIHPASRNAIDLMGKTSDRFLERVTRIRFAKAEGR